MFTQPAYFPLLIITALIYWLLPWQRWRNVLLSAISLGFIYYLDHNAFFVVLILTTFTYLIASLMQAASKKKPFMIVGVSGIVLLLLFFKFSSHLAGPIESLNYFLSSLPVFRINLLIMPLGISYIVFKYISYLMDLYWGRVEKGTFHELLCYGSLFTIFGAGPIERFTNLKPQLQIINSKYQTRYWEEAFIRISTGLFKKLVLADWLGVIVNPVVQNPSIYNPFRLSFTIAAYSLQIYFDFAGYSDIAIGSSKLFGLTVMENFNHPYLAKNIGDFWRRWHISLSIWIRDYLFLPMSRISKIREWMIYLVPPAAMSVCGFWHGSELHFVLWGLLHGIAIDIFQYFRKTRIKLIKTLIKSSLFNLTFVSLAWVVFHAMFKVKELKPPTIIIIVITLPLILLPVQKLLGFFSKKDVIHNARLALVLLILTLALQCFMNTNFIYLNF